MSSNNIVEVGQDGMTQSADHVNNNQLTINGCSTLAEEFSPLQIDNSPQSEELEFNEPLGYQDFLYDVKVEYSSGGNCTYQPSSRFNFKMKYLPYMIPNHFRKSSLASSDSSISESQIQARDESLFSNPTTDVKPVDVTNATCAFLGNSEYVPSSQFEKRRVSLELISAKLSQSVTQPKIPLRQSFVSLTSEQAQHNPTIANNSRPDRHQINSSIPSVDYQQNNSSPSTNFIRRRTTPPQPSSPLSSRKFVNYTLLIKTIPGLDKHPAVIERRFSDFLDLYQRLKDFKLHGKTIESSINFPKKVYMGNFSLNNIAERSIEFTRLLEICLTNDQVLRSSPFISFLLDKELRESHRLLLFGEPEDVQITIETVYHILQKLYLNQLQSNLSPNSSPISLNNSVDNISEQSSPSLSTERSIATNSSSNETISVECDLSNSSTNPDNPSPRNLSCSATSDVGSLTNSKCSLISLNQRILVTFCMLFLTYLKSDQYGELNQAVECFCQLISYQEYTTSLLNTHHYKTLRACLLFLMNINKERIIDESRRSWLKSKLEDIDAAHADLDSTLGEADKLKTVNGNSRISRGSAANRITKSDLTALLRNRNFCVFQDDP